MSDILIRDIPVELERRLEERASTHRRSVFEEIEEILKAAAAPTEGGLGTSLAQLVPPEFWDDDFIQPRQAGERPPPDFR
jgi:plasmid stability protein